MWPLATWSIQRYHFYCCYKFAARPKIVGARISENKTASALVFIIYGRTCRGSLLRALAARSGTCRTQERKIHERNFYRHADILTLLPVARLIEVCGRDFTTESRATPIAVLREKRGFLPRRVRGHRLIRRRNNEPRNGSTQFVGIRTQRTEAAGCGGLWLRVYCIVGNTF